MRLALEAYLSSRPGCNTDRDAERAATALSKDWFLRQHCLSAGGSTTTHEHHLHWVTSRLELAGLDADPVRVLALLGRMEPPQGSAAQG